MPRVARRVLALTALVSATGLVVEVWDQLGAAPGELVVLLGLGYEANLPTWYASSLLLACGVALGVVAQMRSAAGDPHRGYWWVLAGGFVLMSLDEAVELHERLGPVVEGGGLLYFSWVIPAAALVGALGLFFIPFLRRLPLETRRRFLVSGVVYVGGAVLVELPLGLWTDAAGDDNLVYGLIDWVEETLELVGASLFFGAVLAHAERTRPAPGAPTR